MNLEELKSVRDEFYKISDKTRSALSDVMNYRAEADWLWSILNSMNLAVEEGLVQCSLVSWLLNGKKFVTWHKVERLQLIDRQAYYNLTRGIWYFFCYHQNDQLTNTTEYLKACTTVPSVWVDSSKYDRISSAKEGGYYDALPVGGWLTEESALKALNQSALEWAKK